MKTVLAGGLFNRGIHQTTAVVDDTFFGLFNGGGIQLFECNFVSAVIIAAGTLLLLVPLFVLLKAVGILRISAEMEIIGNDVSKHDGVAYPIDSPVVAEKAAASEIDNLGLDESLAPPPEV